MNTEEIMNTILVLWTLTPIFFIAFLVLKMITDVKKINVDDMCDTSECDCCYDYE
jgi:hypothetical protein